MLALYGLIMAAGELGFLSEQQCGTRGGTARERASPGYYGGQSGAQGGWLPPITCLLYVSVLGRIFSSASDNDGSEYGSARG